MKVLFLTVSDETIASSRTRVYQYLPFLERQGVGCRVLVYTPSRLLGKNGIRPLAYHLFILARFLILSLFYPVLFIQKVMLPRFFLVLFKTMGKKVVFDFDDAIYTIHQSDEKNTTPRLREKTLRKFTDSISLSDLVVLENDHNKEAVEPHNPNIVLITGPIDVERYKPVPRRTNPNQVVIGWIGSPQNTFYLEPLFPVFRRICARFHEVVFTFIGSAPLEIPDVNLRLVKWDLQTETRELQTFDIGIMPIPDDEWTRGKGGYKLLQYMALGIPSVATPVGINASLIEDGTNGFSATTEKEWFDSLSFLVEKRLERERMGSRARELAVARYSFEVATSRLLQAINGPTASR